MDEREKQELRKKLLEGMCKCAQNISEYYLEGDFTGIIFRGAEIPKSFRPTLADKFLFQKILDNVIDNIANEWTGYKDKNPVITAMNILAQFYYPKYGEWIKKEELISKREFFMGSH